MVIACLCLFLPRPKLEFVPLGLTWDFAITELWHLSWNWSVWVAQPGLARQVPTAVQMQSCGHPLSRSTLLPSGSCSSPPPPKRAVSGVWVVEVDSSPGVKLWLLSPEESWQCLCKEEETLRRAAAQDSDISFSGTLLIGCSCCFSALKRFTGPVKIS